MPNLRPQFRAAARRPSGVGLLVGTLCGLLLAALAGCGDNTAATPKVEESSFTENTGSWFAVGMGGMRAGYINQRSEPRTEEGQPVVHVQQTLSQHLARFGQNFELTVTVKSVESAAGKLQRFEAETRAGGQSLVVAGQVSGETLHLRTTAAGKTIESQMPWPNTLGGLLALEQSLERQPMQPGEKRAFRRWACVMKDVVVSDVQLAALDFEPIELRGDSVDLLRIEVAERLAPDKPAIASTIWTDRQGRTVKLFVPSLRQEFVKCAKTEAQQPITGPRFDVGMATAVPFQGAAKGLLESRRARYRIGFAKEDPAKVFTSGPSQRVRSLDAKTAELTVQALRPDTPGVSDDTRPTQADLERNDWLQSDDPRVVALAQQVAPRETDRWKLAVELERHAKATITSVNFASAMLTAAEVAEKREGDCTEHAMLLAAMLRARGLPARVAIGLVQHGQTFAFHMWTEAYIVDRWIALDAIHGRGGIGAGYLKLTDTNLAAKDGPLASLLSVIQVAGQFESLTVLEAE